MPTQSCPPECNNCGHTIPHDKDWCPNCGLTPHEVNQMIVDDDDDYNTQEASDKARKELTKVYFK